MSVDEIAAQPDPVGEVLGMKRRPNGLLVGQVRVPLGVIAMIYEARPNVTVDAAALALKSGNAVLLRGGSDAASSNAALGRVIARALAVAAIHPERLLVSPAALRSARRRGVVVNAWTVNDADEARELAALGVDGLITDRSDLAVGVIADQS